MKDKSRIIVEDEIFSSCYDGQQRRRNRERIKRRTSGVTSFRCSFFPLSLLLWFAGDVASNSAHDQGAIYNRKRHLERQLVPEATAYTYASLAVAESKNEGKEESYDVRTRPEARKTTIPKRSLKRHRRRRKMGSSQQKQQAASSTSKSKMRRGGSLFYSQLTDVWFCLAVALGWTVWMLSSFLKNNNSLSRYHKSVLIRGHVLQVSVENDDSLGTGIPTYKAVIDYMVENEHNNSVQIRKHFETQNPLEEGFANVDLLVLPTEPTHSVLREDWAKEVEDQQKDMLDQAWCFRSGMCKRFSISFAGILVLVSIAGAAMTANKLSPEQSVAGWVSLCFGVTMLLPGAIWILKFHRVFQRSMDYQSVRAGVIIQGEENMFKRSSNYSGGNNHGEDPLFQCEGTGDEEDMQKPVDMEATLRAISSTTSDWNKKALISGVYSPTNTASASHLLSAQTADDDDGSRTAVATTTTAGSYFVEVPPPPKPLVGPNGDPARQASGKSASTASSMSSMSSS